MSRNELAKELNVWPCDIDDWLLRGCPAKKIRMGWEFDLERVEIWLETEKIKIRRMRPHHLSTRPIFDQRWFRERCPVCIDRGFPEERAGRVYTLGEISEGEWHLRRTGIPCGHSAYLNYTELLGSSPGKGKIVREPRSLHFIDKHQFEGKCSLISDPRTGKFVKVKIFL